MSTVVRKREIYMLFYLSVSSSRSADKTGGWSSEQGSAGSELGLSACLLV